ncbi:hypothetical protein T484DRAFT_2228249 [Baffinella frigidus]|nr:hypothetical protein T484DRAFT_2228249 [Cryptophyta sp. CCMP2293]
MGTEQNSPGAQARLASSTDIPDIPDGNRHTVRVRYQPWMDAETVSDPSYKASPYSAQWLHGGGGVLIIWVDDLTRPVLSVPVNLTSTLSLDAGMAFVGFTAATGAALQNHYIYSWSITESTCQLDCSNRGDCVQGVCHCIDPFYGATCALSPITQDFSSRHLCPILLPDTPLASAPKPDPDCLCAPGFTGPEGGPCFACPVDTWKFTKGPDVCIPCPPNSDSQRKYGVKTRDDCVCKAGYTGATLTPKPYTLNPKP